MSKQVSLTNFITGASSSKKRKLAGNRTTTTTMKTIDNSRFAMCPICDKSFSMYVLMSHAEICIGKQAGVREEQGNSTVVSQQPQPQEPGEKEDSIVDDFSSPSAALTPWWIQQNQEKAQNIENPIFPTSEPIPGLYLFHEFVTKDEEQQILSELDGTTLDREGFLPWKFARFNGPHRGKRWGVHCNLRDRRVGAAENPLPPFYVDILLPKLQHIVEMKGCRPNEANAIDYARKNGDFLSDHVDDRQLSKEPIANLSIAGDCYMTFVNQRHKSDEPSRVLLPRRTLQVLTGKARYDYSHGIRNQDLLDDRRVSITMRESPLSNSTKIA